MIRRLVFALTLSSLACTGQVGDSCTETADQVLKARCMSCHSASVTGDARQLAPVGVNFDSQADVQRWASRIRQRAIVDQTMPPGMPLLACEVSALDTYLKQVEMLPCQASCVGRSCGDDGCGGSCGTCPAGQSCTASSGQCNAGTCTPSCAGKTCGSDGCGGSCGSCGTGFTCSATGQCTCVPQCSGKSCGPDGCGGSCGSCASNAVCTQTGACQCVPACTGKQCGSDGCGGTCGSCPAADPTCDASNQCVCVPNCTGRQCGPNGCGGTCGMCSGALVCNTNTGRCGGSCTPSCSGRVCGDDGCGGTCGTMPCPTGEVCNTSGQCVCQPSCLGKSCGPDGCGGSCGTCGSGLTCSATGQCGCTPSCSGRVCGSDGCGGSCGTCPAGSSCSASGTCGCVPQCAGKTCGSDGCSGTCGTCASGQTCVSGVCSYSSKTYGTDVFPLWSKYGCSASTCHGGTRPADGLNLGSTASYSQLVGVASDQCSGKIRVVKNDVSSSYLVNKLTGVGMCLGSQMPKGGAAMSTSDLDTVRAWISTGANP